MEWHLWVVRYVVCSNCIFHKQEGAVFKENIVHCIIIDIEFVNNCGVMFTLFCWDLGLPFLYTVGGSPLYMYTG